VTLRLVAQHADMWHGFGDAEVFRHKSAVLEEHCAAVGRDPGEIERTWAVPRGDADTMHATAEELRAAGVTHLITSVGGDGSGYDLSAVGELVAWRDRVNAAA
jgi:hypothetical protein